MDLSIESTSRPSGPGFSSRVTVSATSAFRLALRGLRLAVGSPEVRRTYLKLALALVVISSALVAGLGWAAWTLLAVPVDATWLMALVWWALRLVAVVLAVFVAPLLALFIVNIVFPFLAEGVFFAGLRVVDPARAEALASASGAGFATSTAASVRRLFYYLGGSLLIFLLAWVPVLGVVLGPLAQLWFTARMLSWELLDVYFERRGLDYVGQRTLLKAHRGAMFGFGAPWTLLLALPILGPLGFGLAQAAAALLVTEVLEPESRR